MQNNNDVGNVITPDTKELRLYGIFTGIFCTALVLVPILGSKFIAVGKFALNGSVLCFPLTFIFNDILTEVYGYKRSRRIIWTGMACQIMATLMILAINYLPSASFWTNQEAYKTILGMAPRITLASLLAYFFSEYTNSLVLSKMKFVQKGKKGIKQAYRFIMSTFAGELVDSTIFISVGFIGVLSGLDIFTTILTSWIAKTAYEVILLPLSLPFTNYVKKYEGMDHIDHPESTNYSPFSVFMSK